MKKLLSIILAIIMTLSAFSCVSVYAVEDATTPETGEATEPEIQPTYATVISEVTAKVEGVYVKWTCDGAADKYNVYRRAGGEAKPTLIATVTSLDYTDKTVKNAIYYKYHIEAVVDDEIKATSEGVLTKYLEAPKNLKVVIGNGSFGKQLELSWSAVEGATRYDIYCRAAGQTEYEKIAYEKANRTSTILSTVRSGYVRYAVVAVCGNYIGALDTNGPLTKNFEKIEVHYDNDYMKSNGLAFYWYGDWNTTGYRIYRRAGGEKYYTYLETVPAKEGRNYRYIDTTAQSGKYYKYVVRAVYGTVFGPYDDKGQVVQYIATPKLTGIANATDGIYVRWEPVAGAKKYVVYRRAAGEGFQPYMSIDASKGNRIKDTEAVPLQYYRYTVAAVSDYNKYTEYDKNGLVLKHNPLGTTWNAASIVKYNNFNTSKTYNDVKEYKLESWQKLDSQRVTGDNKQFVAEFDKTMRTMFNSPVNTVINESPALQDLYPGGVSHDSVKSAKMTSNGNYYTITIVLKDEASPEDYNFSGIQTASRNYVDYGAFVEGLIDEDLVTRGNWNSMYKNFTIVSTFTKDGTLVSVTHSCENVTASMDLNFVGGIGEVKYNAQFDTYLRYTNFKYR